MGAVTAICVVTPGSTVVFCDNLVRVTYPNGEVAFHNVLGDEIPSDRAPEERFRKFLVVPADVKMNTVLVRCEMKFEGSFTPKALEIVKRGIAPYRTTLAHGADDDSGMDFVIEMAYVLKENTDGALLLGALTGMKPALPDHTVVAVLDLLGFSHIIETLSLDEIEKRFATIMTAVHVAGFMSAGAFVLDADGSIDISEELWPVKMAMFFDTVVIYPKDMADNPLGVICKAVSLLIDTALQAGWLFSGGIEFGTFRALETRNAYIGKALIGAHHIELSQEWAGAILGPFVLKQFEREVAELLDEGLLVEYLVPLKTQDGVTPTNQVAINWAAYAQHKASSRRPQLRKLMQAAPAQAKAKIAATSEFLESLSSKGKVGNLEINGPAFGVEEFLENDKG
jgi:hypothetical protein